MKTLFILRHAKSSWDNPKLSDFERPLNNRGKKAAPFMGELMAKNDFIPDVILSSPAKRAKQTAKLAKKAGKLDAPIKFDKRIYEASPRALLHIISETSNKFKSSMIVGHNSGVEILIAILCGEHHQFTTANLAVIKLKIDSWNEIAEGCGNLKALLRPREQMKKPNG